MTQNAIACPGMRIDEFPVHDSGEASVNKSLGVVNLPPRPGRGIVWPFLRPSRQSVAQGFLPGLFAMHDPTTTDERHACVVLKPLLNCMDGAASRTPARLRLEPTRTRNRTGATLTRPQGARSPAKPQPAATHGLGRACRAVGHAGFHRPPWKYVVPSATSGGRAATVMTRQHRHYRSFKRAAKQLNAPVPRKGW